MDRPTISDGSFMPAVARAGVLICVLLIAGAAGAQESRPDRNRPRPPDGSPRAPWRERLDERRERDEFIRNLMEGLRTASPEWRPERLERFKRIIAEVAASADLQWLESQRGRPAHEVAREVMGRFKALREARDREFVSRLRPEQAAELERLDPEARRARVNEMRLAVQLDAAIANAMKHGLICDEEAAELRAGDVPARLAGAARLNKAVFLQMHSDELPPEERRRLEGLEPLSFWGDERVQHFRLMRVLGREEMARLRKAPPAERDRLLEMLASGSDTEALRGLIGAETIERLATLTPDDRQRLVRELRRGPLERRKRLGLPPEIRERLSPEDWREFIGLSQEEMLARLRQRFPDFDWKRFEERWQAERLIERLLEDLHPWEVDRLRRQRPEEAEAFLRERFAGRPDLETIIEAMRRAGFQNQHPFRPRKPRVPPPHERR